MNNLHRESAKTKEKDKPFPLEKILTVSARDYCEYEGKKLSDYVMQGVHCEEDIARISYFVKMVPKQTEVVVDYKFCKGRYTYLKSGTALIPKK